MNLFQLGKITLNSGKKSFFKIECDALTEEDWDCLAEIAMEEVIPGFKIKEIISVPTGGDPFAKALQKFIDPEGDVILIVDDVLTTGKSIDKVKKQVMREMKKKDPDADLSEIFQLVAFSRNKLNDTSYDNLAAVFELGTYY